MLLRLKFLINAIWSMKKVKTIETGLSQEKENLCLPMECQSKNSRKE